MAEDSVNIWVKLPKVWVKALRVAAKESGDGTVNDFIRHQLNLSAYVHQIARELGDELPDLTIPQKKKRVQAVHITDLRHLVGDRASKKAIRIIERRKGTQAEIEAAVDEVLKALVPFPAVKIADWFWHTKSGTQIAWALWTIYKDEALTPSQAVRLATGTRRRTDLARLVWFVKKGRLKIYYNPTRPSRAHYFRRSDIIRLADEKAFVPKPRSKKKENPVDTSTPERPTQQ